MKRKIIVGNWKMNPATWTEAQNIFNKVKKTALKLKSTHVVLCPPFIYISKFTSLKSKTTVGMGAQDVFFEDQGAFTGEISPTMLKDANITYCIAGHSERREMGESDEVVARKVQAILEAGIHPIVCVGEKERDSQGMYLETLKNQIKNSLAKTPKRLVSQLIIAYEPVWAIGAKEPMEPYVIEETAIFIKKVLSDLFGQDNAIKTPILYGGAVNFRNAPDILSRGNVDGLLVGRESVNVPGFTELLKAVDTV